jgi:hypothetical protein
LYGLALFDGLSGFARLQTKSSSLRLWFFA